MLAADSYVSGGLCTAVKVAELVASFPQHLGGARKWDGKEATAMNWQSRL